MEALNIEFVREVEKHPELYDYTYPEYSRKDLSEKAWVAVGKKFNLSAIASKEKWRNLRNSFVKNLKRPAYGSSAKKKRSYYLSDAMQFTLPFVKAQGVTNEQPELPKLDEQSSYSPAPETQNEVENQAQWDDFEPPTDTKPSPHLLDLRHTTKPPCPSISSQSSSSESEGFLEEQRSVKRKRVSSVNEDVNKSAAYFEAKIKYAETKWNAAENLRSSEAMRMFLLSLIPDLAALTAAQRRIFKRRTMDLIEELVDSGLRH